MDEIAEILSGISKAVTTLIGSVVDVTNALTTQLNNELAVYVGNVAYDVTYNIIELINNTIGFYGGSQAILDNAFNQIDRWVTELALDEANNIAAIIAAVTNTSQAMLVSFEHSLANIENKITPIYDARMYAIYGQLATFGKAIDAPPAYLEDAIQNGRTFIAVVACLSGTPYAQFLMDWTIKLSTLLVNIVANVASYKNNPQIIKVAVENLMIIPAFESHVDKQGTQQSAIDNLKNRVDILYDALTLAVEQITEDKNTLANLYDMQVAPALSAMQKDIDAWKQDTYNANMDTINRTFTTLYLGISRSMSKIAEVLGLLDYGGDLLLRIDSLPENIRTQQEYEITEVTTRRFFDDIPNWLSIVDSKRA